MDSFAPESYYCYFRSFTHQPWMNQMLMSNSLFLTCLTCRLWCLACRMESQEWHIMECVAACRDGVAGSDRSWNDRTLIMLQFRHCVKLVVFESALKQVWMIDSLLYCDWLRNNFCLRRCALLRSSHRNKMGLTPSDTLQLEWELRRWYHRRPWRTTVPCFTDVATLRMGGFGCTSWFGLNEMHQAW